MDPTEDLLIAIGPRALLACTGIVVLVAGVWHADRTWDEEGSNAYEKAKKAADDGEVKIPQAELDAAFPFPWAFVLGWLVYATSYFFPVSGSAMVELTVPGALASFFSLALSIIASAPMGEAVRNRNAAKKKALSAMFILSWLGLTISSSISAGNKAHASFVLCALGAVSIVASMNVLWASRKMGNTWEQEGRPNPNPKVYNMGGPLFVLGWFFFFIGMAGTDRDVLANSALPVYFTLRSALVFFAGCGMVPVVLMVDYAHDEGAEYVGFGTDGRYFGRFFESPIPFVLMWTLFGVASFVNLDGSVAWDAGWRQCILLVNCILQGIDAGILIQTALYQADMERKDKWSIPFVILFLTLAVNIGLSANRRALALSLPGALLVILGQKTVFGDRKRGDYFMMNNGVANPNPIVYSAGEPLFMLGWILLSLALSLPM